MIRQLGPNMIQQIQSVCSGCGGSGETIREEDKCGQCKGQKLLHEKKVWEVVVDKGMKHGQKITLQGGYNEAVCNAVGCICGYVGLNVMFDSGEGGSKLC